MNERKRLSASQERTYFEDFVISNSRDVEHFHFKGQNYDTEKIFFKKFESMEA